MWYIIIVAASIGLVINAIVAGFMKDAATLKGYGEDSHIFAICFWLGLLGYLYVISLPDLITQEQNQRIIDLLNKSEVSS